jgi:ABC-type dipeptide/oligopeptide/nickel transport system permease subunit
LNILSYLLHTVIEIGGNTMKLAEALILRADYQRRIEYSTRIPMFLSLSGVLLSLILDVLLGAKWGCYTFAYGIPVIILSETWLSFIGLGFCPPAISWGVLLQSWWRDLDNAGTVPQLLLPGVVMVLAVAAFKLVGDGLHGAIVGNT